MRCAGIRALARRELPTEAQWEFAARGGRDGETTIRALRFGRQADRQHLAGRLPGGSIRMMTVMAAPHRSGASRPNGYGLYDMIGTRVGMTSDWYRPGPLAGHGSQSRRTQTSCPFALLRGMLAPGHQGWLVSMRLECCSRYDRPARQPQRNKSQRGLISDSRTVRLRPPIFCRFITASDSF